jgi:tetratricopeptide (TPR) repeat protein
MKYTQSQLASTDFSVSYISAIERGQIRPSLRALEILAQRLGLASAALLPQHGQSDDHYRASISTFKTDGALLELEFLEAQISILQGAADQAIAQLEKIAANHLQDRHLTQQRYLLGWAYLHAAQFQKCQEILVEAKELADKQNDHYSSLHIYHILGMAFAATHDHPRALQAHQHCLKLLDTLQPHDPFFRCHIYTSLGQHYTHLNDFDSAMDTFKQAIAIAEELLTLEQLQSIYRDIALEHSNAHNYLLAALYSYKCLHLHSQQVCTFLRSQIYHYLGRTLMKSDQGQARAFLEDALQQKSNRQDPLTRASIIACLAEWFYVHDELQEAEKHTEHAYELAKPFGDSVIAADTLLCWGHIRYAQAKYEEGDQHFEAGLKMLERLRMYEEFSEQSASYAQLLSDQGKAQEAIAYYRLAIASRQRGRGF